MKIGILIFITVLNSSLGFTKIISGRLFDVSDEQPAIALFVFLNNEMKTNTDINGYFEFVSEEFNELND